MGIVSGISLDVYFTTQVEQVYAAEAHFEASEPREVLIEVVYDWTSERIEQEIRDTFPESPDLAVKIAKCESGLVPDIQSQHMWRGEQERSFGIFQVHKDSWHNTAISLGLTEYQTDVKQNLAMARYIYENAGHRWTDWSCYTKKMV